MFGNSYEENKYHSSTWRSVRPPVHPTDPKNSVCHNQKTLTHQVFVMKINHCDHHPSQPRLQGTFPEKMASILASESDSVQLTDRDYVIM